MSVSYNEKCDELKKLLTCYDMTYILDYSNETACWQHSMGPNRDNVYSTDHCTS